MNGCFGETLPQFHTLCECECFCETLRMFVWVVMLLCHNRELFRQSRDETVLSLWQNYTTFLCYDITRMCGAGFMLGMISTLMTVTFHSFLENNFSQATLASFPILTNQYSCPWTQWRKNSTDPLTNAWHMCHWIFFHSFALFFCTTLLKWDIYLQNRWFLCPPDMGSCNSSIQWT